MVALVDTDPLSSLTIRQDVPASGPSSGKSCPSTRPLALGDAQPAPDPSTLDYCYDPQRQVAVDAAGRPLSPNLAKDWTTIEGTHTDGDGGDNEMWQWEEN